MNRRAILAACCVCSLVMLTGCDEIFGVFGSDDDDGPADVGITPAPDTATASDVDLEDYGVGGPCGDIDFYGECDGNVLLFCNDEEGVLAGRDCSAGDLGSLSCLLVNNSWGYDCVAVVGQQCANADGSNLVNCDGADAGCIQEPDGYYCRDSVGTCAPDLGQVCQGDLLLHYCGGSGQPAGSDCAAYGLTCQNDACFGAQAGETCNEFVTCESGLGCVDGTCSAGDDPECTADADCDAGFACVRGECIEASTAECLDDDECNEGFICDAGECVEDSDASCVTPLSSFLSIRSDADVQAVFDSGCTVAPGQVTISGSVTDLGGLQNLTEIEGDLRIQQTDSLQSADGLDNLTRIGGELVISQNDALSDLRALIDCREAHGLISVADNPMLESMQGLNRIRLVDGQVIVTNNDGMLDLEGLDAVDAPNALTINDNDNLINLLGIAFITEIQGNLEIRNNARLETLEGLQVLQDVSGVLVSGNDSLRYAPFSALTTVRGGLTMASNASLDTIDFRSLTSVGTSVDFTNNPSLPACEVDNLEDQLRSSGFTGTVRNVGNDAGASCF